MVHRLARAGGNPKLFSRGALSRLFKISKGVPRLINVVADRALLGAYVEGRHQVSGRIVSRAASEVLGRRPRYRLWVGVGVASISAAGVAWAYLNLPQVLDRPLPTIPIVSSPAAEPETKPLAARNDEVGDALGSGPDRVPTDVAVRSSPSTVPVTEPAQETAVTLPAPAATPEPMPAPTPGPVQTPSLTSQAEPASARSPQAQSADDAEAHP